MSAVEATAAWRRAGQTHTARSLGRYLPFTWLGCVVISGILGATVFADRANLSSTAVLDGPSAAHPFGTDALGRDVMLRVISGATVSLSVATLAVLIGVVAGATIGTVAALSRRVPDEILMRGVDILLAFPAIVLALLISLLFGTSVVLVAATIGIVLTPQFARLVRGRMGLELGEGYVTAERSTGAGRRRIVFFHVARNIAPPIAAYALLLLADAILFEAALSYIGTGVQPPRASWGNMILEGQQLLISDAWWVSVFPGLALFLTVASLNLIADRQIGLADEQVRIARR